jgi:hypothetical protein
MDHFDQGDVRTSIQQIDKVLTCGIFSAENSQHILFRAAFIETLISLRDLMYKSEKYAARIAFKDNVQLTDKITDITSLIKHVRDALCHPDSPNHYLENGSIKASFNVIFGSGCLLSMPNYEQSSPYNDDICFFFGSQRIFLNRHIIRAFEEAKTKLLPLLSYS